MLAVISLYLTTFFHHPVASPLPIFSRTYAFARPAESSVGLRSARENALMVLDDSLHTLYESMGLAGYELPFEAFRYGMIGYQILRSEGRLNDKNLLTIIDFTQSSRNKRFYTIDLDRKAVKYHTYVSHGKNTGEDMAESFSNIVHSNQSSLGFYVTAETYIGSKGFSLKLDGPETGVNDNVRERAVVIHGAAYVSERWIRAAGRLGRSQGCPALPQGLCKDIIQTIKNNTAIFAYYKDDNYLSTSAYLNVDRLPQVQEATQAFAQYSATASPGQPLR
jgi:hypothetical protein